MCFPLFQISQMLTQPRLVSTDSDHAAYLIQYGGRPIMFQAMQLLAEPLLSLWGALP
jgi:hypothetical protein